MKNFLSVLALLVLFSGCTKEEEKTEKMPPVERMSQDNLTELLSQFTENLSTQNMNQKEKVFLMVKSVTGFVGQKFTDGYMLSGTWNPILSANETRFFEEKGFTERYHLEKNDGDIFGFQKEKEACVLQKTREETEIQCANLSLGEKLTHGAIEVMKNDPTMSSSVTKMSRIFVEEETGTHIRGSIVNNDGKTYHFFAKLRSGSWRMIFHGENYPLCATLVIEKFPENMQANCSGEKKETLETIWMSILPIQCLGNPWEQEYLQNHNTENYPAKDDQQISIIKDYYEKQGIPLLEVKKVPLEGMVFCSACDCPAGYRLEVEIAKAFQNEIEKDGFTISDAEDS
ncbi:hypothetical protein IPN35_01645 [Candidatus Peregrinibacteria bacterium]|nr:MAG: hypothetical protein IPN35_01645 [Candidatus Peregrinibacteria bacterium]